MRNKRKSSNGSGFDKKKRFIYLYLLYLQYLPTTKAIKHKKVQQKVKQNKTEEKKEQK